MAEPFRLPKGGRIDRARPVSFTFDGRAMTGRAGDTLASALIANGVHMVGRSFKYHRPRGILGAGSEDPAGLLQVGPDKVQSDPNTRATETELYEGLIARPQNVWPSLGFDVGALNDLAWRWLPAGFYYKTFMGPPLKWMSFEPTIRRAAGLGLAPEGPDPERYISQNRHVDVLVAGGGAAGLLAALSAARSGARVILAEERSELGGRLLALNPETNRLDGRAPADWIAEVQRELESHPEVTILTRTTAFGYYADNFVGLLESVQDHIPPASRDPAVPRQRYWRVRAAEVVLATGAVERPLVFHGNDRPGTMLASAAETYIHRYGVRPGRRAVVLTNNSGAWQSAMEMAAAGVEIAGIVDLRPAPAEAHLKWAGANGIPVHSASAVVDTSGGKRVTGVKVKRLDGAGGLTGSETGISCDLLAVSGGWSPNAALFSQSRGKLRYDETIAAFRPGVSWQRERSVGGANGTLALADRLAEGARAGAEAATKAGFTAKAADVPRLESADTVGYDGIATWELPSARAKGATRAFIDLQNDVQAKDLKLAVHEGYRSVEHVKRYTTTGMGTDQGKTVNVNAFGILSEAMGKSIPEVGVTTYRQPFKPVTFGAIAGQHSGALYAPRRTTPMHEWHEKAGAIFEPVGEWLRAQTYPRKGESFAAAVQRESRAARTEMGVLDASTLGKIDIRGRDAREFLNRVYTNSWTKLAPGRCRYGLMLKEDGMVFDDGVTACIADDHFHMTTTTGGAARVLGWLEEYLQTEWPDLDVRMTTVTEQWAVAAICGPKADRLVADLVDGIDASPDAFPFMSFKDGTMDGVPVRVYRISFTGELSYEINIAASYGLWMWERVMTAGKAYGITPYGTEAMHLLRAEKGFIIVGQDTDGTMTPGDLRMDWIVKKDKDFIGRRSLHRSDTVRKDRRQLVGLVTEDARTVIMEGAHVIDHEFEPVKKPTPVLGHVTSSYSAPI
ncbi:MAG: sarcosine oxidase subunit alpha family protein [Hyphomicrobiaceae bacterium]